MQIRHAFSVLRIEDISLRVNKNYYNYKLCSGGPLKQAALCGHAVEERTVVTLNEMSQKKPSLFGWTFYGGRDRD